MKWKDAAANLKQAHPEDTLHPLYTPWGEKIAQENQYEDIWREYPRPQLKRENYRMLNGAWDYAIVPVEAVSADKVSAGKEPMCGSSAPSYPAFQGTIRVPFSPECLLSGVGKTLMPEEYLWYHRDLTFPEKNYRKNRRAAAVFFILKPWTRRHAYTLTIRLLPPTAASGRVCGMNGFLLII